MGAFIVVSDTANVPSVKLYPPEIHIQPYIFHIQYKTQFASPIDLLMDHLMNANFEKEPMTKMLFHFQIGTAVKV